ncbi:MAG TPA: VOC family protein [Ignavibacteria bacterium]|nr:VOC family protein [Ignavibacteria bacterium]HMQ98662.1 VOC family protein [Ignavibacteria bacterium]
MFKPNNAFSGFSVNDISKTKEFYAGILGMKVKDGEMGTLNLIIASGSTVIVYPKPNHVPAEFTILNFPVSNIDEAVDELTEKGITFLKYDNETIKTDHKGVMRGNGPDIAWFTDPAGNILSVIETESF